MTDPRTIPSPEAPVEPGPSAGRVGVPPGAPPGPAEPDAVTVAGEPVHVLSEAGCIRHVLDSLAAGRGGWVITLNTDILRRLRREPAFREMAAGASLRVADGIPLLWAATLQRNPLPGRVAGSNLIDGLSAAAAEGGRSVFFLGGDEGTAEAAAEVLTVRYPGLRVAGTCCPPQGFENDPHETDRVRRMVTGAEPDIVYVALGCPKQERVISGLRDKVPGAWWVGVGISFSFLSGRVRRAPRWMQRTGLEWVHRLAQEPRRLARRYLVDDLPYGLFLIVDALRRRYRPGRREPDRSRE